MIAVEFSPKDLPEINYQRVPHPHPRVRQKMEALWRKSPQLPHPLICRLVGISGNTLRSYLRAYQQGGLEKVKELHFSQPQSQLRAFKTTVAAYCRQPPPATFKEAAALIEKHTGIKLSAKRVGEFLKTLGLNRLKVAPIPAKADAEEQETFLKEKLHPRLQEAQAGNRAVFFGEAAHFVLAPFVGFLGSFTRVFIKAPAGRKRVNVLGAIDALTPQLITVTNAPYLNSHSVAALLQQLYDLN